MQHPLAVFGRFAALLLFILGMAIPKTHSQCSQPSNLTSTVVAGGTVSLSWSAQSGATFYRVQYRVGNSGTWLNGGAVTTTNQVLTGLLPETVYTWRVRANCSTFSSVATFTTGGNTGATPSVPNLPI